MHRKQKLSYVTSGRNPEDLDLLDGGSEDEIQSLTLEEHSKRFLDAGVGLSIDVIVDDVGLCPKRRRGCSK